MRQHFDVLGYLFIALGVLTLLGGLIAGCALGIGGEIAANTDPTYRDTGMTGLLAGLGAVVFVVIALFGALYLATGYGLLKRERWGRVLGLVAGALSLLSFPIGTAIGIYALWALTRPEAQAEFG
jgi:dipeptide/tripeptide permease